MAEIMMFNPSNLHQQLVQSNQAAIIDKMLEQGWVKNPPLIHVYHPALQDDKMVMAKDVPLWEVKGYYAEPTWIYNPDEGAKLVSAKNAEKAYKQGWYSSPAQFPGNREGVERGGTLTLNKGVAV